MDIVMTIVALIGWKVSGFDFTTLFFYIELYNSIYKLIKHYVNDKVTKR